MVIVKEYFVISFINFIRLSTDIGSNLDIFLKFLLSTILKGKPSMTTKFSQSNRFKFFLEINPGCTGSLCSF